MATHKKTKTKVKAKAPAKAKAKVKAKAKAKLKAPSKKVTVKPKGKTKAPVKTVPAQTAQKGGDLDNFFTPLDDRVAVVAEKFEKTAGGIFIPSSATDKPQQGRVLAVGRGHRNKKGNLRAMDVEVGNDVLFTPYAGVTIDIMGQEVLILRESDILGVVG